MDTLGVLCCGCIPDFFCVYFIFLFVVYTYMHLDIAYPKITSICRSRDTHSHIDSSSLPLHNLVSDSANPHYV